MCDLFECVLFKVPSAEEAKLDDRFRLGVWIGKTSRGDDHLIFDGDEVRKCQTVKRRPEYLRRDRVRVDAIDAHPAPRERVPRDRRKRYITWAYIKKFGGTTNCKACAVDGPSHSKNCRERFETIFRKEDEEKAMREAADAAATSAALQDEAAASSMNPPTTTVACVDPMHVELARDKTIPATNTGGAASSSEGPVSMEQAKFDVEITEATPIRSEFEEMPRSTIWQCAPQTVWAAQADYDDPRSSGDELERKAAEESDAVHTHEGEPLKSFEVPIRVRDIVGVKSGVVLDPAKVQVARQNEIDIIARHEVVELVKTSECKQGTHVKGGWVEDNKGDIVRSRFVAKQVAYDQRDDVSQQLLRCSSSASCLVSRSPSRRSSAAALWCCPFRTIQWRSSMR